MIWGVVPVKDFGAAKQRLGGALPPAFRRQLAAVMVEDVLEALAGAAGLAGILVVTVDPEARRLAERHGARTLAEGATGGHTAAVVAGGRALAAEGIAGMLSVPGDVPGITAAEIDDLIAAHGPSPAFTIVPAHDGRGSNAVIASPPGLVPLAYGNDSFLPHLAAARRLGIEPTIRHYPGIGLDIDNPEDLLLLAARDWPTRTHAFLRTDMAAAALAGARSTVP